jgi:hypothetical protein
MAVDLAVALLTVTAGTLVQRLVEGGPINQQDWSSAAAGVVQALISHTGQSKAPDYRPALAGAASRA